MNGKTFQAAETQIILKTSAGPVERFAAEELRRALREISGSAPPVQTEGKPGGFSIELETLAKENPEIRFDGFRIAVSGATLRIAANLPRGVLNGVYELLDFWGCRWFFYRESPLYPQASELPLPESGISNPDLELRGVCIFPVNAEHCEELRRILDWLGRNRFNLLLTSINRTKKRDNGWEVEWRQVERELLPELIRRGTILNISEHSGRHFFPVTLFEEHPEWFAMNAEGRRFSTGQICYSNEEAVKVLVRNFTEYAEKHPEVSILGTWPEDGYGFCKCENCSRPGTVLKAVNRIADAIRKVRPDLTVEYLSYTSETSDVPPDILPRDNMSILIANMRVASEWKAKIDKVGGRGVYRLHYHITDNTAERANLALKFHETAADCREAKEYGLRGIIPFFIGIDTWWRSSLNLYFLGKLSWSVSLSAEEILSDLCEKLYPSVAKEMTELFLRLEKIPIVDQKRPPRWPLWQEWESMKSCFSGPAWEKTKQEFDSLSGTLCRIRESAREPAERFRSAADFIAFQKKMFEAWHFRAMAVQAFERNAPDEVRKNLQKTAECEQRLADLVKNSANGSGVAGAWIDYEFFLNWRLQLDKQLLEMRTKENAIPVTDENPDVELFLPGLLEERKQ